MHCATVRLKCADHALGLLSDIEARALLDHCASCDLCAADLARQEDVIRQVKAGAPAPVVSDELRARLLRAGSAARSTRRILRFRTSRIAAGLAAAAVLTMALIPVYRTLFPFSAAEIWRVAHVQTLQSTAAHAPVVLGGRVFTLREEGESSVITAFDRITGGQLWHSSTACYGYMAVADGGVYAVVPGTSGGIALAAFDAVTGETRWQYDGEATATKGVPNTPVISEGALFWSDGTFVCRLNPATGVAVWSQAAGSAQVAIRIVAAGNRVYAAGENTVRCLDAGTGDLQWETVLPGETFGYSQPVLVANENGLYIGNKLIDGSSFVAFVNYYDGAVQWQKKSGAVYHLAVAGTVLVVRSATVIGLDGASGEQRWSYPAQGCSPVSIAGSRALLVSGGIDGALVALNVDNGKPVPMRFPIQACAGIVVNGNMGFVQDNNGVLHAVRIGKV